MVTTKIGSTKAMESYIRESIKNGGSFIFVDGKWSGTNFVPNGWFRIGKKIVIKKGNSFYKDGNKLGKRKANLTRPFIENISQL
jgi:hypothetical protein